MRWNDVTTDNPGLWRYRSLLGLKQSTVERLADEQKPEFMMPVEAPELADRLGIKQFYLLPLTSGPGGTFKDCEAAVVIGKLLEDGPANTEYSWHSTGNTARAYREYANKAGFRNHSFFPIQCLSKWNGATPFDGSTVVAYNGSFQEVSGKAKKYAKSKGLEHLAPLEWKLLGKAPVAFPIAEYIPHVTTIVQTIAGGYGPLGIQQGIEMCRAKQLLTDEQQPKFAMFQIRGADTISRLMPLGRDITETDLELPINPFEPTLQSTNPLSTFAHVRNLVQKTNSSIDSVDPQCVINHRSLLEEACSKRGIPISFADEKSSFISWAGLVNKADDGRLSAEERIVMLVTGSAPRPDVQFKPDFIMESDDTIHQGV
jgi:threonine synthase